MAECMLLMAGGGGVDCDEATALEENVLDGKSFGGAASDELQIGSMVNNGAVNKELLAGASYNIPEGYHNGYGKITAKNLAEQTEATAEEADIVSPKTAVVNGKLIAGKMPDIGTIEPEELAAGAIYTIPAGRHSGLGIVKAKNLTKQTPADALAEHITVPYTAWVNGTKVVGTNPDNGAVNPPALSAGASYTIPRGHHNGNGRVVARDLASQTQANAGAGDILLGKSAWVNGRKINGTMPSIAAQESAKSVSVSGDYVYLSMSNGAHISNANSGFPEIYINKNVLYQKMGSRVSFNGANFDGGLLTGFADGLLRGTYFAKINGSNFQTELSASIDRTNDSSEAGGGEPFIACWAFNPSININPYKNVKVTISYSFSNISILPNGDGFNMIAGLISTNTGSRGKRGFDKSTVDGNIYGTNPSGALTSTIDCSSLTGEYFLAVFLYGSRVRRRRTHDGLGYEHVKLEKIVFNV